MSEKKDNNLFEIDFNSFYKDYSFYGSDMLNTSKVDSFANIMTRNKIRLYFEMSDDMSYCEEIFTGKKFINISKDEDFVKKYYSEEMCIYILVPKNYKDYPANLRDIARCIFDLKYFKNVANLFDMYQSLNERDQYLTGKASLLKLTNKQ